MRTPSITASGGLGVVVVDVVVLNVVVELMYRGVKVSSSFTLGSVVLVALAGWAMPELVVELGDGSWIAVDLVVGSSLVGVDIGSGSWVLVVAIGTGSWDLGVAIGIGS